MTAPTDATETPRERRSFDAGGRLLDRGAGVQCPACHSQLIIGELAGCQFAGCADCGGMMFRQDVFGVLIQHLRATTTAPPTNPEPLDPVELRVRRECPACANMMEAHAYAGPGNAVIDTCFSCQLIWFDQGELTKLVRAPGRR